MEEQNSRFEMLDYKERKTSRLLNWGLSSLFVFSVMMGLITFSYYECPADFFDYKIGEIIVKKDKALDRSAHKDLKDQKSVDGGGPGWIGKILSREPKQKFILQGIKNRGRYRVPVVVLENGKRLNEPRIRLVVYDYLGRSTWYLSHKWEPVGTIDLYPSSKYPGYNYDGYWTDRKGKAPVWFKFNEEKTKASGKVFLYGKWHNCWLEL